MLSLKTLLNPAPPGQDAPFSFRPSPTPSPPTYSATTETSNLVLNHPIMPPPRTSKESNNLAKSKLRGHVKFPPFENLDDLFLQQIQRFRVTPFGYINQSCSHIPYNSGKKDFFEKTGRESFEVFRYEFTTPSQDAEYTVMWDYNVGLVRMTPFFKCLQYGKTVPAKMLSLNPGLKEITHSITGGSIAAQGYWMPYQCARAVCATFCFHIAGALIPIFGPSFPSECVRPDSPEFARMAISPQLVAEASREADIARRMHMSAVPPSFSGATSYPRDDRPMPRNIYAPEEHRQHSRPRLVCDPSWTTGSDADHHYQSAPNSASSTGSGLHGYMIASRPASSWTAANHVSPQPDNYPHPLLSAVPRVTPLQHRATLSSSSWGSKRRLEQEDWDCSYRDSASPNPSSSSAVMAPTPESSPMRQRDRQAEPQRAADSAQKNAAMLLLNLSMHDQGPSSSTAMASPVAVPGELELGDTHRHKRQRATSL
ncbi:hypothetical protein FZEAL_9247 [Fusarium zealandicum]|uniref:HTH APSES-type domain-containing protein n=1 Tax=Fusarium zealandicum TaxID=1053134 RepID=A0A8H4UCN1_9HYPO|nr:hypothetical protein FZEAL_9247 [Fusarium zealandicum]